MSLERFVKNKPVTPPPSADAASGVILLIGAQSVRCGGAGTAAFVLQRLGFQVWHVPTALVPWGEAFGSCPEISVQDTDLKALIDSLIAAPWLGEVRGVLSAQLATAAQGAEVARLVRAVKEKRAEAKFVCASGARVGRESPDPAFFEMLTQTLVPLADCMFLNSAELAQLSGFSTDMEQDAVAAARCLGSALTVITSAPALRRNCTANILVEPGQATIVEHAQVANAPEGAGGVLAALFYARLLEGMDPVSAVKKATASVFELVARSVKMQGDELLIPQNQAVLLQPMALINARRIMEAPARA